MVSRRKGAAVQRAALRRAAVRRTAVERTALEHPATERAPLEGRGARVRPYAGALAMLRSSSDGSAPRLVRVHLVGARAELEPLAADALAEPWSRAASFGGSALAAALVGAELERDRTVRPLVLAVGDAVRRGLPTAARAVVAGVAPLTGRYGEGQVGGELGPRLAALLDGLLVTGGLVRDGVPRALVVGSATEDDHTVTARVVELDAEDGRSPAARIAACAARCGPGATLACGPAGERGVDFASLASGSPPSFVGRGGLGRVLGDLGLVAVHLAAPAVAPVADPALERLLRASPRLVERARGGGFEQALGEAVREGAGGAAGSDAVASARAWSGGWSAAKDGTVGCRGCPTPCGFVFDGAVPGAGAGVRGHFGAAKSLGPRLGLDDRAATLVLLERCDALGLDAKEAGAVLALLVGAGCVEESRVENGRVAPALESLLAWLDRIAAVDACSDAGDGAGPFGSDAASADDALVARARAGADALARRLDRAADFGTAGLAQPGVPRRDLAALALAVGAGAGTDPLRSYPFASEVGRARLAALVEPSTGPLPPDAERPDAAAGKGLVAWWHESFVAGVDTSGFCVFSASGLLADGVCDLDALAQRLIGADGEALLARGAATVLLRAELARRLDRPLEPEPWARDLLEDGLRAEYRAARGVDARGFPTAGALAAVGSARLGRPLARAGAGGSAGRGAGAVSAPAPGAAPASSGGPGSGGGGQIRLRCLAGLGAAGGTTLELDLPSGATLADLLAAAAAARPAWRDLFLAEPGPSAWCAGRRLEPGDRVPVGATVDLLRALAGG